MLQQEYLQKRQLIVNKLRNVIDPEISMDIVSLGLVYAVHILDSESDGLRAVVEMTLTTPGCPLVDFFQSEVESVLLDLDFLSDVKVVFAYQPAWDISMIDERAKLEMFNKMRG